MIKIPSSRKAQRQTSLLVGTHSQGLCPTLPGHRTLSEQTFLSEGEFTHIREPCHSQLLPLSGNRQHWSPTWFRPLGTFCGFVTEAFLSNPFEWKHSSVLPGNTLYFSCAAQFSLPVCVGLPCYQMDHRCMVNQSLHIKGGGHLIWDEGVQVGLGWGGWGQQTLLLLCFLFFLFFFLLFDILLLQLASTNQEPAPRRDLWLVVYRRSQEKLGVIGKLYLYTHRVPF